MFPLSNIFLDNQLKKKPFLQLKENSFIGDYTKESLHSNPLLSPISPSSVAEYKTKMKPLQPKDEYVISLIIYTTLNLP